jgi:hypothetical protein
MIVMMPALIILAPTKYSRVGATVAAFHNGFITLL